MVVLLLQTSLLVLGGCAWHLLSNSSRCQTERGRRKPLLEHVSSTMQQCQQLLLSLHTDSFVVTASVLIFRYTQLSFIKSISDPSVAALVLLYYLQIVSRLEMKHITAYRRLLQVRPTVVFIIKREARNKTPAFVGVASTQVLNSV